MQCIKQKLKVEITFLKRFPLDQLKIDQSFVKDLNSDEEGNAIVLAVIALAKALKLEIIAEGVETKEQLDFLLENGCENIQGFYFSYPLEKEEMQKILLKRKD
jgi:EAL domain-containing protein (putative c-di-GMP-specific phosphodiesterase class I)